MREAERLDAVVIGAGVIGLAVARALSLAGRQVVVLEAESAMGMHASSRNSEVIHAGIYYPTGSWKARLCVAGKSLIYQYCAEEGIAHERIGKLIVATSEDEFSRLQEVKARAEANGVSDLVWLDEAQVRDLEPNLDVLAALMSPSTGIVDSHAFMAALRRDAERSGAHVVAQTPVLGGRVQDAGIELDIGGKEPMRALCRSVVNAAGLRAQEVSRRLAGLPQETVPGQFYAKGHYFVLQGRAPFSRLVYPVPVPGGLGVHVTLDLAHQVRFGPDVCWIDGVDYEFDQGREEAFYRAIRSYFPALPDSSLTPGYTGIRPKLGPKGSPFQDFVIQGPGDHGIPGLVNLYGIESPGLTAALALAHEVKRVLGNV